MIKNLRFFLLGGFTYGTCAILIGNNWKAILAATFLNIALVLASTPFPDES